MASAESLLYRQLPCLVGISYEPWQGMWRSLEMGGRKRRDEQDRSEGLHHQRPLVEVVGTSEHPGSDPRYPQQISLSPELCT